MQSCTPDNQAQPCAALSVGAVLLPENIADAVICFLDFYEYCSCIAASSLLCFSCKTLLARIEELKVVAGSRLETGRGSPYRWFPALRILDVAECASDALLSSLTGLVPNLTVLRCVKSPLLTDDGLARLVLDHEFRSALAEIDLTFCQNTSYGITLHLRQTLPGLKLIRRIPAFLAGHFITPFGDSSVETHTYYADGSFDFSRRQQSRGYVRSIEESHGPDRDEMFLKDALQYCNFNGFNIFMPEVLSALARDVDMPGVSRFLYRPGVAVRPGPSFHTDSTSVNSVLVAQNLNGMFAPDEWPPIADEDVPLGQSIYFDEAGGRLPQSLNIQQALGNGAVSLISRMEVRPLESLMPPPALVDELDAFERSRIQIEELLPIELLQMAQSTLHQALGGRL